VWCPSKYFSIVILVLAINACQEKEEKVLDLESIRPKENIRQESSHTNEVKDTLQWLLNAYNQDSVSMGIKSIEALDNSNHFLQRFNPTLSYNWQLKSADSALRLVHSSWEFKDSISTLNAIYNWFDIQFQVKWGQTFSLGNNHFLLFIGQKRVDLIESNKKLDFQPWWYFIQSFDNRKDKYATLLIQEKRKKTKWYQLQNNTLTTWQK
jgi:hypothetical protein